jgi:mannobiose 2-epimerase
MEYSLQRLKNEIESEVQRILTWWRTYSPDLVWGGFAGEIDRSNQIVSLAHKGSVLNARILWTFSAAYNEFKNEEDRLLAGRAYEYIASHFYDPEYSGVYWSLNKDGRVYQDRKQIYALAFTIYGLAEYYKISPQAGVLQLAVDLFYTIERYSYDPEEGGYFEAFTRDWKLLDDLRLSDKDRNDPKTMNTHLHIIEAYANLYGVWKDPQLLGAITGLLDIFEKHIINKNSGHLDLFFDRQWHPTSQRISYGHDIEAAWLLHQCAVQTGQKTLAESWKMNALKITDAAAEGIQPDGSFIHEYDGITGQRDNHREWWVSAEGMVGFLNSYQLSQNKDYLERVYSLWTFTQTHLIDPVHGEWKWGVLPDYSDMDNYKMGFWKCPYHNVRACLEIRRRIVELNY